jgi:hypothetical protein
MVGSPFFDERDLSPEAPIQADGSQEVLVDQHGDNVRCTQDRIAVSIRTGIRSESAFIPESVAIENRILVAHRVVGH